MNTRDSATAQAAKTETDTNSADNQIKWHKYPLNVWFYQDGMFFFESGLLRTTRDDFDYTGSTLQEKKKQEEWPVSKEIPTMKK